MPLIAISDELKEKLDQNKDIIKNDYLTYKLFVDSAVRAKLRAMGIEAGQDEVIEHLEKLEASKSRHLDKQTIKKIKTRHKQRVARAKRKLNDI